MTDTFEIKNYQIIKNGKVELRPGITLITGPSNNGKSSIFKAYKQLIYNLSGNTYINQFADQCKLSLENDDYKIEYFKTRTKAYYDITTREGVLRIDKPGVNQLDKIKELTHIDKEMGYNFWDQLEKPFLLCETNREQFLLLQESPISSNLLNIQENIKADIKILKDDTLVAQGSLNIVNDNLSKYDKVLRYSDVVHNIVSDMDTLNRANDKINILTSKLQQLDNINKELDEIKKVSGIEVVIPDIKDIYDKYNYFNNKITEFTNINNQIASNGTDISKTKEEADKLEEIFHNYFNICPLCGNILDANV